MSAIDLARVAASGGWVLAALVLWGQGSPAVRAQCSYPTPVTAQSCQEAIDYNGQTGGVSLLVWVDGQMVCEDYNFGGGPTIPQEAWSGTKSFWSTAAAAAIQDGLIASWDERVSDTITEWQPDPRKSQITVRQLLSLTSGIDAEDDSGSAIPYAQAIQAPALYDPGTVWEYGSNPYQCFGEFLRRKVAPTHADPLEYLRARVLDPIGAEPSDWTYGTDGYPFLPYGSRWLAREWVLYGELVRLGGYWPSAGLIVEQELLDAAFHASAVKNDYGMTWWLPPPNDPAYPCDGVFAYGLATQKLYVIRSLKLVAVRQTNDVWDGWNFDERVFLDRLLDPPSPQDDCPPEEATGLRLERAGDDVVFDWSPVYFDETGNVELVAGYDVFRASAADFSDGQGLLATAGSASDALAPGEALPGDDDLTFYRVAARDKCGNAGP